jgi:pyruvate dehydrogenase E1 component alpha subunit
VKDVVERSTAYGVPGVVVDGNDVLAVYEVAEAAVRRARAGGGLTLIECKTYRWRNHTEIKGIPDNRPPDEIAAWKEKDPIARLVTRLKEQQLLTDEDWKKMDAAILQEIEQAVAFAKESPFPPLEAALEDVFAD